MTSDLFTNISGQWVAANLSGGVEKNLRPLTQRRLGEDCGGDGMSKPQSRSSDLPAQNSFDGKTYVPELDRDRLKAQLVRVRELMRDGKKRSLAEIAQITGDPESSVSARLRDLRKPKNGLWTVNRQRRSPATFEYWLGGKGL